MDKLILVPSNESKFQVHFLDDHWLNTIDVLQLPEWSDFIGEEELH